MNFVPLSDEARTEKASRPGGWCLPTDVQCLRLAARRSAGNILEIGCNNGQTTREMALAAPTRAVYAVDLTANPTMCSQQKTEGMVTDRTLAREAQDLPNVRAFNRNSQTMDWNEFPGVRLIFIDGDHTYRGVKADTERAIDYLRRHGGGDIYWHDVAEDKPVWVGVLDFLTREVDPVYPVLRIRDTWLAYAHIPAEERDDCGH